MKEKRIGKMKFRYFNSGRCKNNAGFTLLELLLAI